MHTDENCQIKEDKLASSVNVLRFHNEAGATKTAFTSGADSRRPVHAKSAPSIFQLLVGAKEKPRAPPMPQSARKLHAERWQNLLEHINRVNKSPIQEKQLSSETAGCTSCFLKAGPLSTAPVAIDPELYHGPAVDAFPEKGDQRGSRLKARR